MIQVCSYCKIKYGEKEPFDDIRLTHGICHECYRKIIKEIQSLSYDQFLEVFDIPVLVINPLGKVYAANKKALKAVDKPIERVEGLLGGDALECKYAKSNGGCGNSAHCPACTIRNLVMDTLNNKEQKYSAPVSIKTKKRKIDGYASTLFVKGAVCIIFEEHFIEAI